MLYCIGLRISRLALSVFYQPADFLVGLNVFRLGLLRVYSVDYCIRLRWLCRGYPFGQMLGLESGRQFGIFFPNIGSEIPLEHAGVKLPSAHIYFIQCTEFQNLVQQVREIL